MSYSVPEHIHFREVHDEVMLLDAQNDAYFALNPTGAVVWSVLASGRSPEAAAARLAAWYAVTPERAEADVAAVVDELVGRGLLNRLDR